MPQPPRRLLVNPESAQQADARLIALGPDTAAILRAAVAGALARCWWRGGARVQHYCLDMVTSAVATATPDVRAEAEARRRVIALTVRSLGFSTGEQHGSGYSPWTRHESSGSWQLLASRLTR